MSKTLKQIVEDTRTLCAAKQASFSKQALTGQDPASMPGSEHDSKTPDEAKKPNKETRDESMVPNSGLSAAGAGDDSSITRGHALEADEAAETPKKKPAVSADANAKEASDGTARMANEILSMISGYQKQAEAPAPKKQAAAPVVKAPEVKLEKKSAGPDMALTGDVMAKIAAIMLSTDDGVKAVEDVLLKQAGAEAANKVFEFLSGQVEMAQKQAAFEAGEQAAQAEIERQIFEAGMKAGQAAAEANLGEGEVPGAAEAAGAMAPEGAGAGEGEGQDIMIEDIAQALQAMVQSGEIEPQVAEEVLQQLVGGGEGGGAEGPQGGEQPAESQPLPPEAPGEEPKAPATDGKMASAQDLLVAIRSLKK